MHRDIRQLFQRFGLTDNEVLIYLSCLQFQEGLFTHEIVRETKINRSTIDFTVERLIDSGFLSRAKVGARYKYFAQPPQTILIRQEQLMEDLRSVIPMLDQLQADRKQTEILYFEGRQGLRKVYDDVFLRLKYFGGTDRELIEFTSGAPVISIFSDINKSFIQKRVKLKIPYRAISPSSTEKLPTYDTDPKFFRQVRFISDKDFPFDAIMGIYADSIMVFSSVNPVGGIIIRNNRIAQSMRALFNCMWGLIGK